MARRTDTLPLLVLILSSVGWGLTWIPLRALQALGIQGPPLVLLAFAAGTLLLLPFLVRQRHHWRDRWHLLLLIAVCGGFANLAFQIALFEGEIIRVMILFYLLPIWSLLGGWLFLGEGIDSPRIIAVICALLGTFFVLGGVSLFETRPSWLDLLAIAAGMAFALNNLLFRASQNLPLSGKVSAMFAGCALLTGIYLLHADEGITDLSPTSLLLAPAYGMLWLTLISFGTQWGVTRLPAGRASIIITLELVTALVSASLLLDERMTPWEMFGALLVIGAGLFEAGWDKQSHRDA
jgi:drug/metabolite transporter (DMT)-like permease